MSELTRRTTYLQAAMAQLDRRRRDPESFPPDCTPTYAQVRSVLEEWGHASKATLLTQLAGLGTDLEALAFIIAQARQLRSTLAGLRLSRNRLHETGRKAMQRAMKANNVPAMIKAFASSQRHEADRLSERLKLETRSNPLSRGRHRDWVTSHTLAGLELFFRQRHGRPHIALLAEIVEAFELVSVSARASENSSVPDTITRRLTADRQRARGVVGVGAKPRPKRRRRRLPAR